MTAPRSTRSATVVRLLPTLIAASVVAGVMVRVRERWFIPVPGVPSYAEGVLRSTLEGTAIAPNQYRPLMPWVDGALATVTGISLMSAMLVVDLALAVVLLVLLHRLCGCLGRPEIIVVAAACLAYWTMRLAHWHPELMLLMVLVTATALLLTVADPNRWLLAAIGLVMCLGRTDYAATLGLALVATGWQRRDARLAAVGGGVSAAAVVATVVLVKAYPGAHYVVDVIQIGYNLTTPNTAIVAVVFYGPLVLLPLLVVWWGRRWPTLWPMVLWFGLQFGATLVVGRVAESRIFLPFAPALAIVAALAFLDLRGGDRSTPTGEARPPESAVVSRTGGPDVDP